MNCADSVLNSDELPVRGIDQCPSTLSTQWAWALSWLNGTGCWLFSEGLIIFMFCWSRSLFKMCKSLQFKGALFFRLHSGNWHCASVLWRRHRCSFCALFAILTSASDACILKLEFTLLHEQIFKKNSFTGAGEFVTVYVSLRVWWPLSKHLTVSQTHLRCLMWRLVVYLWPLNDFSPLKGA